MPRSRSAGLPGRRSARSSPGPGSTSRVHLAVAAALCGAVGLVWSRRFLPGSADASAAQDPVFVRPPRRLWALGALAFACLLIEGGAADWSGVYIKDELGTGPGFAALGFTAFSVTMTLGRIFGDRAPDPAREHSARARRRARRGPRVRRALVLSGAGRRARRLRVPRRGDVLGRPDVFRAAGQMPGIASGVALSAVSSVGYLGFVAGPPSIGGIAELSACRPPRRPRRARGGGRRAGAGRRARGPSRRRLR